MPDTTPAPLRSSVSKFSQTQAAACSVQGCPKKEVSQAWALVSAIPDKPCNLQKIVVSEPKADTGARAAEFLVTKQPSLRSNPLRLRTGADPLQITAPSKLQGSRQLNITSVLEAWCGEAGHQKIRVEGPDFHREFAGTSGSVGFSRRPLLTDGAVIPGFWSVINACWQAGADPAAYDISSVTCGLPSTGKGSPTATLLGRIEVFPADAYELSIKIPALLQPEALSLDVKSREWEEQDKSTRKKADAYYASEAVFFREAGISRMEVRKFVADMDKKKSGEDDKDYLGELEVKFKQTDGARELEAPIDDVIGLVRCIRSAEYRAKKLGDWISEAQVGPGAMLKVECQFLAGSIEASWQRKEHSDNRVFVAWEASLDIDVVKLEVKIEAGWRCLGLADLTVEIGGEGTLGISGSAACKAPDEKVELELEPKGELELTGKIKSQLMWMVSGETGIECTFEADCGELYFMRHGKVLEGDIVVKRGPVERTVSVSSRVYGGTADRAEVMPGNDNFATFHLGS